MWAYPPSLCLRALVPLCLIIFYHHTTNYKFRKKSNLIKREFANGIYMGRNHLYLIIDLSNIHRIKTGKVLSF